MLIKSGGNVTMIISNLPVTWRILPQILEKVNPKPPYKIGIISFRNMTTNDFDAVGFFHQEFAVIFSGRCPM